MTAKLRIDQIKLDGGTQPRAAIDQNAVRDYAEALQNDAQFPPVTVFYDGNEYWLADGFHRLNAHKYLDWLEIDADVKQGTRREAVLFSVGANAVHGLRRTNADKRRAVETLLNDSKWNKWTDREIARQAQVDHKFVGKLRAELTGDIPSERTYTTKHGTQATMQVSNIGKRPAPAPEPSPLVVDAEPLLTGENTEEARFTCATCHNTFSTVVSHCANCGHHYPPEYGDCRNCYQQLPDAVDGVTGEVTKAELIPPREAEDEPAPTYSPELLEAAHKPMATTPYQPVSAEFAAAATTVEELRGLLGKLLSYKGRVTADTFADAGLTGGAVANLAFYAHRMLGEWLTPAEQRDAYTLDAEVSA